MLPSIRVLSRKELEVGFQVVDYLIGGGPLKDFTDNWKNGDWTVKFGVITCCFREALTDIRPLAKRLK